MRPGSRVPVRVAMMDVRIVRVRVGDGFMAVRMRVRFRAVPIEVVVVLMVFVMDVAMRVGHRLVRVFVFLGEMQSDARAQPCRREPEQG